MLSENDHDKKIDYLRIWNSNSEKSFKASLEIKLNNAEQRALIKELKAERDALKKQLRERRDFEVKEYEKDLNENECLVPDTECEYFCKESGINCKHPYAGMPVECYSKRAEEADDADKG